MSEGAKERERRRRSERGIYVSRESGREGGDRK